MFQVLNPLATTLFGLSCALVGGLSLHLLQRLRRRRPSTTGTTPLDTGLDQYLASRAQQWADQRGTPDLADDVHHRFRTAAWLAGRTRERYER